MELLLPIFGIALIAVAFLQFGLWTGRGIRLRQQEKRKFDTELEKLRAEIYQITSQTPSSSVDPDPSSDATCHSMSASENDRPLAPGDWKGFRSFRVANLVRETVSCMSVYLVPVDEQAVIGYQPGQHLTLRFPVPGNPVRCYTLSDSPGKDFYRISVKQTGGLVSSFVNSQLKPGDTIDVKSPGGSFFLQPENRPVVLLAGGVGITPMLSMINSITESSSGRECLLVYGVRNGEDHAFGAHLRELAAAHKNIYVVNCFSQPLESDRPNLDYHVKGFVSLEVLQQILPDSHYEFYLCGPPAFMECLHEGLTRWGVDESRIRYEAFGPASIRKNTDETGGRNLNSGDQGTVAVRFSRSQQDSVWDGNHDNLLDFMESQNIAVVSGCRAGSCGTCQTRLLKGQIQYEDPDQIDCEPGHCLPCVAVPQEDIEIDA